MAGELEWSEGEPAMNLYEAPGLFGAHKDHMALTVLVPLSLGGEGDELAREGLALEATVGRFAANTNLEARDESAGVVDEPSIYGMLRRKSALVVELEYQ